MFIHRNLNCEIIYISIYTDVGMMKMVIFLLCTNKARQKRARAVSLIINDENFFLVAQRKENSQIKNEDKRTEN